MVGPARWVAAAALVAAFGCNDGELRSEIDAGIGVFLMDSGPAPDGGAPVGDAGARADTGSPEACAGVSCPASSSCDPATGACVCDEGFVDMGAGCVALPPGDPAGREAGEVCAQWRDGHREDARPPWTGGAMCDPGTLAAAAFDDTVRRVNMFRWLVGLGPVVNDMGQHAAEQDCAMMMNAARSLSHTPGPSWPCYTEAGAGAAGRSNLALGSATPGDAIDLYVGDRGVPSLGHRRWVLNFGLGRIGVGFAGNAQCLGVFDMSARSERTWTSWPNPGPTPVEATQVTWSFHMRGAGGAAVAVETFDGSPLGVESYVPPRGFGPDTIAWDPSGWTPSVGQRYRVTISGVAGGPIVYVVEVVAC